MVIWVLALHHSASWELFCGQSGCREWVRLTGAASGGLGSPQSRLISGVLSSPQGPRRLRSQLPHTYVRRVAWSPLWVRRCPHLHLLHLPSFLGEGQEAKSKKAINFQPFLPFSMSHCLPEDWSFRKTNTESRFYFCLDASTSEAKNAREVWLFKGDGGGAGRISRRGNYLAHITEILSSTYCLKLSPGFPPRLSFRIFCPIVSGRVSSIVRHDAQNFDGASELTGLEHLQNLKLMAKSKTGTDTFTEGWPCRRSALRCLKGNNCVSLNRMLIQN